jgi:hypothetical protein
VPRLGFLERNDFARFAGKLGWGWADGSSLRSHVLAMSGTVFTRNADDSVESAVVGPSWDAETKNGSAFGVAATFDRENVAQGFPLSDKVSIAAGNYSFVSAAAYYTSSADRSFTYMPSLAGGQYFGGNRVAPGLSVVLRATEHVVLTGNYTFNYVEFTNGQPNLVSHLGLVRAQVMINTQLSLTTFAQVKSVAGSTLVNARLRFNPREGHDLYLVYDNSRSYDGRDPTLNQQTFLVKYTYMFDLSR